MPIPAISTAQLTDTSSAWTDVGGGSFHTTMTGTWGSATAKIQVSPDGGTTALDIAGASATANATFIVEITLGCVVRVVTAGGANAAITTRMGRI